MKELWKQIIAQIDDTEREGLIETPERMQRFYQEFFACMMPDLKQFETDNYDQMVVVKSIPFYSLCEHHILPFFGHAAIGYLPQDGKIVGLSKLARLVDYWSHRLQVQERMTQQIANSMCESLTPNVAVILRARHMCMEMRGVTKNGTETMTSEMRGVFRENATARTEFLAMLRQ